MSHARFEDSVPLDTFSDVEDKHGGGKEPRLRVANVKLLVTLFIIFIVVVSDVFTNSFGEKAVRGRSTTAWGVVLQGIFLVIFYVLAVYLTEHNIL